MRMLQVRLDGAWYRTGSLVRIDLLLAGHELERPRVAAPLELDPVVGPMGRGLLGGLSDLGRVVHLLEGHGAAAVANDRARR